MLQPRQKQALLADLRLKDVNPTECGEEYCPKTFHISATSRKYYLIHYVFSGEGTLVTLSDKFEYSAKSGQMFIIHPHEMVSYYVNPDNPWHYLWVGFELSNELEPPLLKKNHVISLPKAEKIFSSLKNAFIMEQGKELFVCGKIYELLSMLQTVENTNKSSAQILVENVRHYIDINYMNRITVDALAKNFNVNRSYLSTIFQKYMGKSPQQYIIDVRLENAAHLIANYDYTISDAAKSSGYEDIYNFSKRFKQKFGVPPKSYKKQGNIK